MSLSKLCSQYPIYRKIVNNISSLTDVNNLIYTSPSIYESINGISVRKTFFVPNSNLVIEYEFHNDTNNLFDNFFVNHEKGPMRTDELLVYFKNSTEFIEHIKIISIDLYNMDRFCNEVQNYDSVIVESFLQKMAAFIDELFDICPNADTLTFASSNNMELFIIKYLKSPKIKALKELKNWSGYNYLRIPNVNFENIVNGLKELREIELVVGPFDSNIDIWFMWIFESMAKDVFKKKDSNISIILNSGLEAQFSYIYNDIIKKYNIQIALHHKKNNFSMIYEHSTSLSSMFPFKNVVELNFILYNNEFFTKFFKMLPSFCNVKTIKILVKVEIFQNIKNIENVVNNCAPPFDERLLKKLPNVEKMFIQIDDINEVEEEKLYLVINLGVEQILKQLKDNLKVLYLGDVPRLSKKIRNILITNCPNLMDLYLHPILSIDINFVKRMKNLKFIGLKGFHNLNIPDNIELIIIYPNDSPGNEESINVAQMNNIECFRYLKEKLNRFFRISLRNSKNGFLNYIVLCNNVLHWSDYIEKSVVYDYLRFYDWFCV